MRKGKLRAVTTVGSTFEWREVAACLRARGLIENGSAVGLGSFGEGARGFGWRLRRRRVVVVAIDDIALCLL